MRHPTRRRLAWAVAAALGAAGPVNAFYWDGWPGSSLPSPRSLVPTADSPPNPSANPIFPPGGHPGPTAGPTPGGPPTEPTVPNPEHVPEPASAAAVLIGLGALAARRLRRA